MVFCNAFNIISVITLPQLTYSCFSGVYSYYAGALKCVTQASSLEKPGGSSVALTCSLQVKNRTLYHRSKGLLK